MALMVLLSKSFLHLRKLYDCYALSMQHATKEILTTKLTKATKDSEIFAYKLRALRVLRGEIHIFCLRCGSTLRSGHSVGGGRRHFAVGPLNPLPDFRWIETHHDRGKDQYNYADRIHANSGVHGG